MMETIIASLLGSLLGFIGALFIIFVLPLILYWTIWFIWKTIKWTFILIGVGLSILFYTILDALPSKY